MTPNLCCLHPFLAKKLSYVLCSNSSKDKKIISPKQCILGFPQTFLYLKSGVQTIFRAKNDFCYLVTKKRKQVLAVDR